MADFSLIKKVLDRVEDGVTDAERAERVLDFKSPQDLEKIFDVSLPDQGVDEGAFLEHVDLYIKNAVKTANPQFYNQLWSGFSEASLIAELIINAMNTSMYTYEVAPAATLIEKSLIDTLLGKIGFENGEGIFTTGGTASNISAMLAARNTRYPNCHTKGLPAGIRPCIFASSAAHYSAVKAGNVIGIGSDHVIKVETDSADRMIPEALKVAVDDARERGLDPMAVIATAGTTVAGTFDPINEIVDICEHENIWCHVDGAWGGATVLHPDNVYRLEGLSRADSFCWDAHKMLGVSLMCAMLFTKDKGKIARAHAHGNSKGQGDDYLFHDDEARSYDLGRNSIQCGRRFDSLKLYVLWKLMGMQGIQNHIETCFNLAHYAAEKINGLDGFKVVSPIETPSVCFRFTPNDKMSDEALDDLNILIRETAIKDRATLFNYGRVNGEIILRLVFANPKVTKSDIDITLDIIERAARKCIKQPSLKAA